MVVERQVHEFRQSWLNDVVKCPELARAKRSGALDHMRVQSDSMSLGTATHAGIEESLRQIREKGNFDIGSALDVVDATLDSIMAEGGWTDTYTKDVERVHEDARRAYLVWEEQVLPIVPVGAGMLIEDEFRVLMYEDDKREIWIKGTIDFMDADARLWDWKTTGQKYQQWEKQRWAIQPTVYCAAYDADDFWYGIMLRGRDEAQIVHVERSESNTEWLRGQLLQIAKLLEADLEWWPTNDQGWWCSPKWCENWASCKGAHIDPVTWK